MKETINHPDHYLGERKLEPIVIIEDWDLDFNLGNAVKYISRAGRKDPEKIIEDLKKTIWYIERHKEYGKFGITTIFRYNVRKWIVEAYTIEEVLDDWKLPYNLEGALDAIYKSKVVNKDWRDFYLVMATAFIECEISKIINLQINDCSDEGS